MLLRPFAYFYIHLEEDMQNIGEVFNEDMIGMENKEKYKAKIQKK